MIKVNIKNKYKMNNSLLMHHAYKSNKKKYLKKNNNNNNYIYININNYNNIIKYLKFLYK